jgi:hypothetical protein
MSPTTQTATPEITRITPRCDVFCVSNEIDLESYKEKMQNGDWGDISDEGKECNDDSLYFGYGLLIAVYPIHDRWVIEITHDLEDKVMEIDAIEYPATYLFSKVVEP